MTLVASMLAIMASGDHVSAETGVNFKVTTVGGESWQGELIGWDESSLTLQVEGEPRKLSLERLAHLTPAVTPAGKSHLAVTLEVKDGSLISADDVVTEQQKAVVLVGGSRTMTLDLNQLRSLRFREGTPDTQDDWQRLQSENHEGDVLVVRRDEQSLDYLEGTLDQVQPDTVSFQFDGQPMEVRREKLEGVLLFARDDAPLPAPAFQVRMSDDSLWNAAKALWSPAGWIVTTTAGLETTVPLAAVREIQFLSGSVVYLSDIAAEATEITPMLDSDAVPEAMRKLLYGPRLNQGFDGQLLRLEFPSEHRVATYDKGLALHSRTRLVYRLGDAYRELRGIGGMAAGAQATGAARLTIRAGEDILFDELLARGSAPTEFAIPVSKVRNLEIVVDYGDDSDLGDRVHLCDVRLLK